MASRAVSQPAVLGRKRYFDKRLTVSNPCPLSDMRRIATVTISQPLAAAASTRMGWFGYPAVPSSRRGPLGKESPGVLSGLPPPSTTPPPAPPPQGGREKHLTRPTWRE